MRTLCRGLLSNTVLFSVPYLLPLTFSFIQTRSSRIPGTRTKMEKKREEEENVMKSDPEPGVNKLELVILMESFGGWEKCWEQGLTPWDLGQPTPIIVHLHQSGALPKGRALVPGSGSGYDVVAMASPDRYVVGLEICDIAIKRAKELCSSLPNANYATFLKADFFTWCPAELFDLIFDYTFFCAIEPDMRAAWAQKINDFLKPDGELITLIFPISDHIGGPPYKVSVSDYEEVLHPLGFRATSIVDNELAVGPRRGREKLGRWKSFVQNRSSGICGTKLKMEKNREEKENVIKTHPRVNKIQQVMHSDSSGGWEKCWEQGLTPWDIGQPTPIIVHLHQSGALPKGRALVPGCGTGYDVVAMASPDRYVVGLEISDIAIKKAKELSSSLPNAKHVSFLKADFFTWRPAELFDLIFDYTFFCAIEPDMRAAWAKKIKDLLKPDGELITLIFPISDHIGGPPYKVSVSDYEKVLHPMGFRATSIVDNELAIGPRRGREKLGRWKRSVSLSSL